MVFGFSIIFSFNSLTVLIYHISYIFTPFSSKYFHVKYTFLYTPFYSFIHPNKSSMTQWAIRNAIQDLLGFCSPFSFLLISSLTLLLNFYIFVRGSLLWYCSGFVIMYTFGALHDLRSPNLAPHKKNQRILFHTWTFCWISNHTALFNQIPSKIVP